MTINIFWDGELNESNPKYAALSDNDKRFLCPADLLTDTSLPTLLLMTQIGFVSEESIPHIVGRIDFANGGSIKHKLDERAMRFGYTSLADQLRTFIGVRSNIPTTSKSEFVRRVAYHTVPALTSAGVQKLQSRSTKRRAAAA